MTYRQRQQALKQLRNEGKIPAAFNLNAKKEVLEKFLKDTENGTLLCSPYFFSVVRLENGKYGVVDMESVNKNTGYYFPVLFGAEKEFAIHQLNTFYSITEDRRIKSKMGAGLPWTPEASKINVA